MGLDRSISRAIVKFSEIEEIVRCLPGKDCGLCGAPTCATLAEDVVLGKTRIEACPYYRSRTEEPE
jgi:Na+-translocating ferredoxin:NAD+ oxidoreductase RNF subunit RnfB